MKKIVFIVSLILVILIAIVFVTKYYFHRGKVFGNIYLTMQSGDIKRIAGTNVDLYKVDNPGVDDPDRVFQDIRNIKEEYFKTMAEALKERRKSVETIKDPHQNLEESERAFDVFGKMDSRCKQLIAEYNSKIHGILMSLLLFKTTESDIDGRYEFLDIPYEKYIVLSKGSVFDEKVEWLYPIEVHNKENKIDLSNDNSMIIPKLM